MLSGKVTQAGVALFLGTHFPAFDLEPGGTGRVVKWCYLASRGFMGTCLLSELWSLGVAVPLRPSG